jgi:hypothetical protein
MLFRITMAIFASIMNILLNSTAWAELCMQGSYPVLIGGDKGSTTIHQIAYFETTGRIAAGGDTTSTDMFDTN